MLSVELLEEHEECEELTTEQLRQAPTTAFRFMTMTTIMVPYELSWRITHKDGLVTPGRSGLS